MVEDPRVSEELVEALGKRVSESLGREQNLMGIPIPATDRAVDSLLKMLKWLGAPVAPAIERVSAWASERVNWRHGEEKG